MSYQSNIINLHPYNIDEGFTTEEQKCQTFKIKTNKLQFPNNYTKSTLNLNLEPGLYTANFTTNKDNQFTAFLYCEEKNSCQCYIKNQFNKFTGSTIKSNISNLSYLWNLDSKEMTNFQNKSNVELDDLIKAIELIENYRCHLLKIKDNRQHMTNQLINQLIRELIQLDNDTQKYVRYAIIRIKALDN